MIKVANTTNTKKVIGDELPKQWPKKKPLSMATMNATTKIIAVRITGLRLLIAFLILFMFLNIKGCPAVIHGRAYIIQKRREAISETSSELTIPQMPELSPIILADFSASEKALSALSSEMILAISSCDMELFGATISMNSSFVILFCCLYAKTEAQALLVYPMAYSTMRSNILTDTSSLSMSVMMLRIITGVISPFVTYLHILTRSSLLTIQRSPPFDTRRNL